ncbi:hypothetical protein A3D70_00545 [Candidatus Adlerbacteria bacterium RIFCSPHIGHO2_02_FULL_54_18]|uniref:Sortase n=1 Tax=Candidatus Adlerbacteria bacterium RIFCSPHIGHO2_02_FULL_54_18 TaxID=1797241 RepID=A0A1F4Y1Q2_9BACT|nr:MAG: hypothetical protein A3D70_00545 [Candidatus Adlerbacteria bacterium RIFCSPHIGHO2_02_FULL_54_18]
MSRKLLLLSSAKTVVLVPAAPVSTRYVYYIAAVGIVCVLIGAADVSARLARAAFGDSAAIVAFAPLAALDLPAAPSARTALVPAVLRIPALEVRAEVEQVGVKADATMGTPQDFSNVSWYSLGSKPGEPGSTVFAGHVNNTRLMSGVFGNLSQIKKGDYISVDDEAGRSLLYRVYSVETYEKNAPTDALFTTTGVEQLVLITCDGDWVPSAKTFDRRLVVIAHPAY